MNQLGFSTLMNIKKKKQGMLTNMEKKMNVAISDILSDIENICRSFQAQLISYSIYKEFRSKL